MRTRIAPPPPTSLLRDELVRATVLLIGAACVGAVIVGIIAARLTPDGFLANGGRIAAGPYIPALSHVPSRVETNGAPLTVTVHVGPARDSLGSPPLGSSPIRYRVTATPPNAAAIPLCESMAETDCLLRLDGSTRQRGLWVFTLTAVSDDGVISETRARMRVT